MLACNATYDPVTFTLNNTDYNLTSAVLTMDIGLGSNNCILAMYPQDLTNYGLTWILSDSSSSSTPSDYSNSKD